MDHLHDPEFIKTASISEAVFFAYNDGVSGFFPIDTPENTLLSAEYFEKNASFISDKAAVSQIATAIAGALSLHGVTYSPLEKQAEAEDELMKLGAEIINFDQKHRTIPVGERVSHARRLMGNIRKAQNADHTNLHIPPSVDRYGGDYFHEDWRKHVDSRRRLASPEGRKAYSAIAEEGESHSAHEIAALLEHLDHKFGMDSHWDRHFPDPYYGTLSSTPPKKVVIIVMKHGGRSFTEDDCSSVRPEHLSGHFSDDVVERIFSDRSRWDEMPDSVKSIIAKAISS